MWQQNYTPVGDSLGLSALVAAIPIFVLLLLLGVLRKPAWMAALAGLGSAVLVAAVAYGMPTGALDRLDHQWRGVRPDADRVDRLLRDSALPRHGGERQVRDHQGLHRRSHQRPESAGAAHRVRFRGVHRRLLRLRKPRRGGRGDAHRARLFAVLRGGDLPAGQHRAGGIRLHRNSDHDPGARSRDCRSTG